MACFKCGFAIEKPEPTAYTDGLRPPTQVSESNANLLDNKWLLVEQIGAGGMGTVWLAKDTVLDRKVAVKVLSESLATLPEYIERFEREARVMASLDHPNIVTLFAVGRRGKQPYMVMKFLDGAPLNKYLHPRLPPVEALPLFRQMADGLAAMHARNILHRDLKPANLFVSPSGHLTILDLGIARQVGSTLTKTGIMFGTPAYMSPEQIAGDKGLDPRTDIYSAGAVLFEMLTGRTPFHSEEEHSLLLMHIQQPPPDASQLYPDIPRALGIALQRALSKRPQDRFSSITEFYDAVAAALGARPLRGLAARTDADKDKGTKELKPDADAPKDTEPSQPSPFAAKRSPSSPNLPKRTSSADKLKPVPQAQPDFDKTPFEATPIPPDLLANKGSESTVIGPAPTAPPPKRSSSSPSVVIAPDAATPKAEPAPLALQATRKRKAVTGENEPIAAPMPLGLRVLTGIAVTVFVLLAGYFMARVISQTPKDPEPQQPVKGAVVLKQADDTPKVVAPKIDVPLELAKDARTVDVPVNPQAIDPTKVGAQTSLLEQKLEDEAAGITTNSDGSSRPPPPNQLRKPGSGELRITATYKGFPAAATVFLNKKLAGKTPLYLHAKSGVYAVKLLYPNVKPVEIELVADTSKGQDFEMELAAPDESAALDKAKKQAAAEKYQRDHRDEHASDSDDSASE